ncbi:plastocyanin/azurin family copper-binding protein [Pseudanabaena sp. PCC 6802]|uniref:plastocyanin/azurin family copper-binding protein n=1 Tax=Pseudanabaena sp. PCC 6802 TaxID=118173 RepID=UPI0003493635|nr:plastocyanin/azurin family copper-binding protein [Pseudanabaena sp. PCC 6802]
MLKLLDSKFPKLFPLVVPVLLIASLVWCLGAIARPAIAAPGNNILKQPAIEVNISLGNEGNELKFFPDRLKFEAGKHYKLVLSNPSPSKHYFTDKDFADAIWTQKVDAGNVEVKGNIHELELRPGTKAEWVFVAIKPGNFPLRCTVPGHAEAGMRGVVAIE